MDQTNDLTISVAKNSHLCELTWLRFVPYVESLKRSGFKGTKLMFVSGLSAEIRQNLTTAGFKLVDFVPSPGAFGFVRLVPVRDFLNEHADEYRYVLCTDWPDLVFQTNPSTWLEQHAGQHKLFVGTDCIQIKNGGANSPWVRRLADDTMYEWLKEEDACCCGVIIGEAQVMKSLMNKMYDYLIKDDTLIDQGVLNYLLRVSPYKEVTRIPRLEEGLIAGMAWTLSKSAPVEHWTNPFPRLDRETGLVYPAGKDDPFCIVHQYNRYDPVTMNPEWWGIIFRRYTGGDIPEIIMFPADDRDPSRFAPGRMNVQSVQASQADIAKRSLRRPPRWRPS